MRTRCAPTPRRTHYRARHSERVHIDGGCAECGADKIPVAGFGIYHSEGNITRVIDDLISLGIEGINPLEKTVTGMSVPEVRKRWPRLVLWGGVDNKDLLVHGTVDEVRREVEFLVDTYGRDGGLLLGSSGQIHPGCKLDNVIAMYDTALSL